MLRPCLVLTLLVAIGGASVVCALDPLSSKRGFGDVGASYNILQAANAGWYYGWRPDKPSGVGNYDAEFVPMIWGQWQANQSEINNILSYGDVEWVLGFNEPERSDQANISVETAISAWRTLSNGFSGTDVKLVSPGVADTGGTDGGQTWLANFMSQANSEGLKVDAVAFHWYGVSTPTDPVGAANSFLSRVDSYHNSYGLPVWITEFGIIDWGGSYTTEEMREANAIFLENVIPALESRSYVEGYAFYNWTGDTTLVEGSPLAPTNVGMNYVGAIKTGETYDLAGIDMGQHVAYLAGGKLTHSSGTQGTARYINAVSGSSTIGGTDDWQQTQGNWLRVASGATVRKTDTNTIVFDQSTITNDGAITLSQGELIMRRHPTVSGSGSIQVGPAGTLTFDGLDRYSSRRFGFQVELAGGTVAGPADRGGIIADNGASIVGEGTVAGGLMALSGSVVRVGETGISSPGWSVIDDFQNYTAGKLNAGATGGVWTGVFDGTLNAQVVADDRNRSIEFYGTGSAWRGVQTSLDSSFTSGDYSLDDGDSGTYFFRVSRQGTATIDGVFGLTDLDSIGTNSPWNELAITMSLFQAGNTAGTTALRAFDSTTNSDIVIRDGIGAGEWVNVWLVVDNAAKTFQVATSVDIADGVLNPTVFSFGRSSAVGEVLDTFAGAEYRSGSLTTNASVRIDDLYYLPGDHLANPLSGAAAGFVLEAAELTVEGDFTALTGSVLEMDLFDTSAYDRLIITGNFAAGGTLQLSLDAEASSPQAGDEFDLFDFATASGAFDQLVLPVLAAGLSWDDSQLYTSGLLSVVAGLPGDYNDDGVVDTADYVVWRNHLGAAAGTLPNDIDGVVIGAAQYLTWKNHFGSSLSTVSASVAIPEPGSLSLVGLALALGGIAQRAMVSRGKNRGRRLV